MLSQSRKIKGSKLSTKYASIAANPRRHPERKPARDAPLHENSRTREGRMPFFKLDGLKPSSLGQAVLYWALSSGMIVRELTLECCRCNIGMLGRIFQKRWSLHFRWMRGGGCSRRVSPAR